MRALAIVLLMALYVAGYAWSAPHTDSADELLRGYEIARGIAYPMQGPPLGYVLHLGPAWFYLVALPLLAWKSWLAGALFVGLVASLKFPLAYACGKRLVDARFGLLWAVALLVPGWSSLEQIVFLNPNAVAAAILAVLALSLRALDGPRLGHFAALGLLLGFAAHVHPNAAPAALFAVPVFVRFARSGGSVVAAAACFGAAFAIPFLPYAYLQVANGFPDFQTASRYVRRDVTAAGTLNAPSIVWHYLASGPALVAEYLGRWSRPSAEALGVGMAVAYAMAAIVGGISRDPRIRRIACGSIAAAGLFAAWIGAMRPTTPFQFTWALAPALGAVLAAGLYAIGSAHPGRPVAIACVVAIVGGDLAVLRGMALRVQDGEGRFSSRVMDIRGTLAQADHVGGWYPAWAHDRLGTLLCEAPKPLALHGHLGVLLDVDLGLDTLFACGRRDGLALGGGDDRARHVLGMTHPFWRAAGVDPECRIGSLGLTTRMRAPVAHAGLAIATGDTYLPRVPSGAPPRETRLEFDAPPDSALLVTNLLGEYEHFEMGPVQADGAMREPAARNSWAWLYVPTAGQGSRWSVAFTGSRPDAVDIVVVDRAVRRPGCALFAP